MITNYKLKKSKFKYAMPNIKTNNLNLLYMNNSTQKKSQYFQLNELKQYQSVVNRSQTINYIKYKNQSKLSNIKIKKNLIKNKQLNLFVDNQNPLLLKNYQSQQLNIINYQQQQQYNENKQLTQKQKYLFNSFYPLNNPPTKRNKNNKRNYQNQLKLKQFLLKQFQDRKSHNLSTNNIQLFNLGSQNDIIDIFSISKLTNKNKVKYLADSEKQPVKRNNQQNKQKQKTSNKTSMLSIKPPKYSSTMLKNYNLSNKNVNNFKTTSDRSHLMNRDGSSRIVFPVVQNKNVNKPIIFLNCRQSKKIQSESYIVVKYPEYQVITGVFYKKNSQIASLTKIMTFYTILNICKEYQIDFNKYQIEIGQIESQISGTSAGILQGQKYTLQQLFYGLMLPSGNDAATAIALQGGKILKQKKNPKINLEQQNFKCFIKYMNIIAKSIGMKQSNFVNPHGLSNNMNYSSPFQLSLLLWKCLQYKEFQKVVSTKKYSIKVSNIQSKIKRQIKWKNTHKLLKRQGFIGGKTGVTVTAGPCLATIYKSKTDQIFITVVLRAPKLSRRFKQTRKILGLSLKHCNSQKYQNDYVSILKSNKQLDSDNSSQQQAFDFSKNDATEFNKRSKILQYQL